MDVNLCSVLFLCPHLLARPFPVPCALPLVLALVNLGAFSVFSVKSSVETPEYFCTFYLPFYFCAGTWLSPWIAATSYMPSPCTMSDADLNMSFMASVVLSSC